MVGSQLSRPEGPPMVEGWSVSEPRDDMACDFNPWFEYLREVKRRARESLEAGDDPATIRRVIRERIDDGGRCRPGPILDRLRAVAALALDTVLPPEDRPAGARPGGTPPPPGRGDFSGASPVAWIVTRPAAAAMFVLVRPLTDVPAGAVILASSPCPLRSRPPRGALVGPAPKRAGRRDAAAKPHRRDAASAAFRDARLPAVPRSETGGAGTACQAVLVELPDHACLTAA